MITNKIESYRENHVHYTQRFNKSKKEKLVRCKYTWKIVAKSFTF